MASGVIDLSIRPAEKLTRSRLIVRICMVIAVIGVVLAMTLLPDPSRISRREVETRKGTAPAASDHAKPTVGLREGSRPLLHLA